MFVRDWFQHQWEFAAFQKEQLERFADYQELEYLTETEEAQYLDWKDLYFGYDRMNKILLQSGKEYVEEYNFAESF